MTVWDLIQGITELQGFVVVKQYNYETDEFNFETLLEDIPDESPILDKEIRYMYAETADVRNYADAPVLAIEVED